ncbi:hypothetical protein M0R45_009245 [Rubus argutus]|uniref:Pentatricopeptide repeat-containing protein n=1 Tax=Rubus argutus TaxID=59490 RepID=A0AAW1Y3D1_RUBAR
MANLELLLKKCESLTHIKQLQAHLVSDGRFQFYPSITIKLLELCALPPIANIPYATTVFHQLRNPSTRHWNAVVRGLAQSLQPAQAISWYKNMSRASQKVDAVTCSFALKHVHAHWRSLRLCRFILRFYGWVLEGCVVTNYFTRCLCESRQSGFCTQGV